MKEVMNKFKVEKHLFERSAIAIEIRLRKMQVIERIRCNR